MRPSGHSEGWLHSPTGRSCSLEEDLAGEWVLRHVDIAGVITTVAGGGSGASDDGCLPDLIPATSVSFHDLGDLLALAGGDFLFVDRNAGLLHVSSGGRLTQILCGSPEPNAPRYDANLDGRRATEAFVDALSSVALTSDRTLLIGGATPDGGYVAMLSPNSRGRRLGIALTPETHATITRRRLVSPRQTPRPSRSVSSTGAGPCPSSPPACRPAERFCACTTESHPGRTRCTSRRIRPTAGSPRI